MVFRFTERLSARHGGTIGIGLSPALERSVGVCVGLALGRSTPPGIAFNKISESGVDFVECEGE